jgi:hypothetical protein
MTRDVHSDPDLDFLPIPASGSRGQKGTGSRTPYPQHFVFYGTQYLSSRGGGALPINLKRWVRQTACIYRTGTSVVPTPGDVDLCGAGGGIDGGGGGEGAAARTAVQVGHQTLQAAQHLKDHLKN